MHNQKYTIREFVQTHERDLKMTELKFKNIRSLIETCDQLVCVYINNNDEAVFQNINSIHQLIINILLHEREVYLQEGYRIGLLDNDDIINKATQLMDIRINKEERIAELEKRFLRSRNITIVEVV